MGTTDGRYVVQAWQVNGVYALWWVPSGQSGPRGNPELIFGEDRLPMLAAAVASAIKAPPTLDGRPPVPSPRADTSPVVSVPLPEGPDGGDAA